MGLRIAVERLARLEARRFPPAERAAAREFVLGETGVAALRLLDSGHPGLIACEIDGTLGQADADRVMDLLARALDRERPVSLLVKINDYKGFDPGMLFSGPLWTLKLSGIRNLHRYAVVGADPWLQGLVNMANPLAMGNIRLFAAAAEPEAWDWVKGGLGERG